MDTIHKAHWIIDAPEPSLGRFTQKGAIAVSSKGKIKDRGPAAEIRKKYPKDKVIDHGKGSIIIPGLIDTHVHAPQMEMTAAAGFELLQWLDTHTFPTESKYAKVSYAEKQWKHFTRALARTGTTCAAVYSTNHQKSTEALFKAFDKSGLRGHIGMPLQDRHGPDELLQHKDHSLDHVSKMIKKWKKHTRVKPSITVRFAPACSAELLQGAGDLAKKNPEVSIQTHLSENEKEIKWVKELFPQSQSYTELYDSFNLLTQRTILGHGIHLSNREIEIISSRRAHIAHCPSSNFFLGSGLFPYGKLKEEKVSIALASDVGAGWDLNMLATAKYAYGAQSLQQTFLQPTELLFLATRAGAMALGEDALGVLEKDHHADFVVHQPSQSPSLKWRLDHSEDSDEFLAALLFLGNEHSVKNTYVAGKKVT